VSPLTLRLAAAPEQAVDMSPLIPERLAGRDPQQVARVRLRCGNRHLAAGDLFRISGTDAATVRIRAATERLDNIGAGMREGTIEVRGTVGDGTGRGLCGGQIRIDGGAGAWTGAGMRGGNIVITGDAGDFLGAAIPGELEGMDEGTIHVYGRAGDRVGDRQRRGLIIVEGDVGELCGSRMLAGTIIVGGHAGRAVGTGMRRGTIVLRHRPKHLTATFNSCGALKMEVLRLLFRQLGHANRRLRGLEALGPLAERFAGDMARGGKGELLVLLGPQQPDTE